MGLSKLERISEMKNKIEELEEKIKRLEKERRDVIKGKIKKAERRCKKDFESYFDGSKFYVRILENMFTAEYESTKIVLEKSEEAKIRGCMRLKSKGAIEIDKNIKIEIDTKPIGLENEVGSFEGLEDADESYYESELNRIHGIVDESEEKLFHTKNSDIGFSIADYESMKTKNSIYWKSKDGHTFFIPEYTEEMEYCTFPTLLDFLKHEFG